MATVLIAEPAAEIRALLTHVVTRLGHDAVESDDVRDLEGRIDELDAAIVEPAEPSAFLIAERLRAAHTRMPLVFVSVLPRTPESDVLQPVVHLVRPFDMKTLRTAVASALDRTAGR